MALRTTTSPPRPAATPRSARSPCTLAGRDLDGDDRGRRLQPRAHRHRAPACCSTRVPAPPATRRPARPRLRLGADRDQPGAAGAGCHGLGRRRQRTRARPRAAQRRPARAHQRQRRAARRCSRATCASRRSGRTRRSASARPNCTRLLASWLPRLDDDAQAWLVVAKQPRRRLAAALDRRRARLRCRARRDLEGLPGAATHARSAERASGQRQHPVEDQLGRARQRNVLAVVGLEHAHPEHAARHLDAPVVRRRRRPPSAAPRAPPRRRRCRTRASRPTRARARACGCARRRLRRAARPEPRTRCWRRATGSGSRIGLVRRGRGSSSSSSSARATTMCGLPTSMPRPGRATGKLLGPHERLAAVEPPDGRGRPGTRPRVRLHRAHARARADRRSSPPGCRSARPWSSR